MEEEEEGKGVRLFGRNISEIPCFRDSYFYGIWSGLIGGVGYFMFTSKPRVSTNFGMATFCISTLSYWTYCRWKYTQEVKETLMLKRYLQEQITKEGLGIDPKNNDVVGTV